MVKATLLLLTLLVPPALAAADEPAPVVVELFTSQGCSACPPADALLLDLAEREDVIALGLHVDYWDYLGWRDVFGLAAATARQHAYAKAMGERMVYTPQIVVNGVVGLVGSRIDQVEAAIEAARDHPMPASVGIVAEGGGLVARLAPSDTPRAAVVRYMVHGGERAVEVTKGENAGAVLTHANPVRSIMVLGPWNGAAAEWPLPMPDGGGGVVVLVQEAETMAVIGAAAYRPE